MKDLETIRIEAGIPLPESRGRWASVFSKMKIGDSFSVKHSISLASSIRSRATALGYRITIRTNLINGTMRVWLKNAIEKG